MEPDAAPDGEVAEPLVSLLVEPVPVAPIELVPLELGVDVEVSLDAVPVDEPVVDGDVPALPVVDEPGVPVPPLDPVVVPWRLQADSETAATTARAATAAWVRVIFIRELLEWGYAKRKGSRDCPDPTLGRPRPGSVGTRSNRV